MPFDSARIPNERAAVAALLAFFGLAALASASVHSGVPDEVAVHIPSGFLFLETGVFSGGLANPPLGQVLIALPAWLGIGDYVPFEAEALFAPRMVVLGFGWIAALVLWRFARSLVAPTAALAALFFLATSPNFSAHSSFATLDVPITAAILVAVALARRCAASEKAGDFALLGAALGVACSIKVQGLAAIPLVAAQIALAPRATSSSHDKAHDKARARGFSLALALAVRMLLALAVAWLVVHAAYGLTGWVDGQWLPDAFLEASWRKFLHGAEGHTGYFLGELSTQGSWLYFPVALLVKTPIPLLVCAAIGSAALVRSRELAVWVGLPAALFFAMAAGSSINIGIRHLLPFFPFFFLLGGIGLQRIGQSSRAAVGMLCAVQLAEAVLVAPHGLAYFNVLGGGSTGGHRVLLDSNFDWGQHDEQLRAYLEAKPGPVEISPDALAPRTGRVIVGASVLNGILGPEHAYDWLRNREPDARIANTWFEYQVTEADIAAVPKIRAPREMRVRDALVGHVLAAARDTRLDREPDAIAAQRAQLAVARACWALFEYGCTLDRARKVLSASPGDRGAFWLASELTARRRLGALRFKGRELLDGFESVEPAASMLTVDELTASTRRLDPLGVREPLRALHGSLGDLAWSRGDWSSALAQFRREYALAPEGFAVQFKLGWLLATHPDAQERDGELALQLASSHGEQTNWAVPAAHDLHGAALAELGRFEEAGVAARRAIELIGPSGNPVARAEIEAREAAYAVGRPHRQRAAQN